MLLVAVHNKQSSYVVSAFAPARISLKMGLGSRMSPPTGTAAGIAGLLGAGCPEDGAALGRLPTFTPGVKAKTTP